VTARELQDPEMKVAIGARTARLLEILG